MKLLYRLAEEADFQEVLSVQNLSLQILLSSSVEEEVLDALIKHQHHQRSVRDELMVVAVCNEKIIGFIALLLKGGQISGLYVHPDFVRQGIGSELLRAVIDILDSQKHRNVYVLSSEYAKPFYRHNGFRSYSSRYMLLGRHLKVRTFWMRKQIQPPSPEEKQRNAIALIVLVILAVIGVAAALS